MSDDPKPAIPLALVAKAHQPAAKPLPPSCILASMQCGTCKQGVCSNCLPKSKLLEAGYIFTSGARAHHSAGEFGRGVGCGRRQRAHCRGGHYGVWACDDVPRPTRTPLRSRFRLREGRCRLTRCCGGGLVTRHSCWGFDGDTCSRA